MPDAPDFRFAATETDLRPIARNAQFSPQERNVAVAPPAASPSSFFQRLTGAVDGFINGFWTPGKPLDPVAPQDTPPRAFDYPLTWNLDIEPRSGYAKKFSELISLADNCDIARFLIERRKDEMAKLEWTLRFRDPGKKKMKLDTEAENIQRQLLKPDNEHNYPTFQRAMLEEILVKDALALEPVYRPDGTVYGIYGIAGETIQLKIDERGRTPEPPNAAYQQVIKGVPFADFTKLDLYYRPKNLRFSRMFGMSPIEQAYIIINIALRRQSQQLYAFTDGTLPAMLLDTPEGWSPQQIAEYQARFDARYSGNLRARSKVTMIPNGSKPTPVHADVDKTDFDEWIAWVLCYAFGESKEPFTKTNSRATAETAAKAAAEKGLEPLMSFIEGVWDDILDQSFGRPDLRFKFNSDTDIDPVDQATIAMTEIDHGVLAVDDYLIEKGRQPAGVGYVFKTPAGPISVDAWIANGGIPPAAGTAPAIGDSEGAKAAKAALPLGHLKRLPMPDATNQKKNSKMHY